ncbi:MAG: hypothetical protein KC420_10620 [Myxococcales bacterium]|nr:hypothetical protein [Myxococcales bacterium]MCB9703463.1 hypothetical protein [Myxococcales bacterium]
MSKDLLIRTCSLGFAAALGIAGCGDSGSSDDTTGTGSASVTITAASSVTVTATATATATDSGATTDDSGGEKLDLPDDEPLPGCGTGDGACNLLDLLFVIDNSGTMGEEQVNLAANFPLLVERLGMLKDGKGKLISADINIMVTTTDMGHPACAQFNKPGYIPAKGSPINTPCTDRLERFTSLDGKKSIPQACTDSCNGVAPDGPYIHYKVNGMSNVPGDDIAGALSCIGLQGIDGCGYEAQLESMMQALDPGKEWNKGALPFVREGAVLAIVMVTDEADCSVLAPGGYDYFDDENSENPMYNQYWNADPKDATKKVTSAVCWNGGVNCIDQDNDGIYENCTSADKGVLHPSMARYTKFLRDVLIGGKQKEVIMLGILGIPPVTEHNPEPPYEPIAGGVKDLVYRQWNDADILPGDGGTAATKQFEFGIGPGCTGAGTGQAIPPVRIKEVCESLNDGDRIRCCMESICDDDFSPAIECLSGLLQETFAPQG